LVDDRDPEREERIREAIVMHLQRFPRAADTPEGMVACWLPSAGFEDALPAIWAVVESMVELGELTPRALPDGSVLFVRGPALRNSD
jgi:hypothetical protein